MAKNKSQLDRIEDKLDEVLEFKARLDKLLASVSPDGDGPAAGLLGSLGSQVLGRMMSGAGRNGRGIPT